MPAFNNLSTAPYDSTSTYADQVHFVHIYVVEPHPQSPAPSPYSGQVWEAAYSDVGQAYSYSDRVQNAAAMQSDLNADQLTLVDDLTADGMNNPVWCTYCPCPNCSDLIGTDGKVAATQTWADGNAMQSEIDDLLAGRQKLAGVALVDDVGRDC